MWTPSDLNDQLQSLATSPTFTSSVPYNPKKQVIGKEEWEEEEELATI